MARTQDLHVTGHRLDPAAVDGQLLRLGDRSLHGPGLSGHLRSRRHGERYSFRADPGTVLPPVPEFLTVTEANNPGIPNLNDDTCQAATGNAPLTCTVTMGVPLPLERDGDPEQRCAGGCYPDGRLDEQRLQLRQDGPVPAGKVIPVAAGGATITVTYPPSGADGGSASSVSANVVITVQGPLPVTIAVAPATLEVPKGACETVSATANLTDGSSPERHRAGDLGFQQHVRRCRGPVLCRVSPNDDDRRGMRQGHRGDTGGHDRHRVGDL